MFVYLWKSVFQFFFCVLFIFGLFFRFNYLHPCFVGVCCLVPKMFLFVYFSPGANSFKYPNTVFLKGFFTFYRHWIQKLFLMVQKFLSVFFFHQETRKMIYWTKAFIDWLLQIFYLSFQCFLPKSKKKIMYKYNQTYIWVQHKFDLQYL